MTPIYVCKCSYPNVVILDHAYDYWRYAGHGIPKRTRRIWQCGLCGKEYESA